MTEKEYQNKLKTEVPQDHFSIDFLVYLKKNNAVVYDKDGWLIVENCKYHTKDNSVYTAFHTKQVHIKIIEKWDLQKGELNTDLNIFQDLDDLLRTKRSRKLKLRDMNILVNSKGDRSIKLPHVHFIQDIKEHMKRKFKLTNITALEEAINEIMLREASCLSFSSSV